MKSEEGISVWGLVIRQTGQLDVSGDALGESCFHFCLVFWGGDVSFSATPFL